MNKRNAGSFNTILNGLTDFDFEGLRTILLILKLEKCKYMIRTRLSVKRINKNTFQNNKTMKHHKLTYITSLSSNWL